MPDLDTTVETNSPPETLTDATVAMEPSSSTTANELDAASLLGDAVAGDEAPAETPDAPEGTEEAPKETEALIGAPEGDYDLAALMPEGTTVDAEALAAITPLAKEIGLSNVGLAKLAIDAQPIVARQVLGGMTAEIVQTRKDWDTDTRAAISGGKNAAGETISRDPVFGGKALPEVTQLAAKAIDHFVGDRMFPRAKVGENGEAEPGTFRDFLKTTGLGNHPAMMAFAYAAAQAISEDGDFHRSGDIVTPPASREEKYYGRKTG